MLKTPLCEATLTIILSAKSPVLVSMGKSERRPGEQMEYSHWVATKWGGRKEPYIPASSFKGILRSHAERILRSFSLDFACNPLAREAAQTQGMKLACSKRIEELKEKRRDDVPSNEVHCQICPACRLFGCTGFAGRVMLDDVFPQTRNQPVDEAHIAVDRFTQGVALGPFGRKPLDDLQFSVPVTIVNFELWQLGLLALLVRDMNEGLITIGSGGRHGHGEVTAKIEQVQLRYAKSRFESKNSAPDWALAGIGALLPAVQAQAYGYTDEAPYKISAGTKGQEQRGWIPFNLKEKSSHDFFRHCVRECLSPRLKGEVPFTLKEEETHA